jgi:hypothetical protein
VAISEAYSGTKAGQTTGDTEWSLTDDDTSVAERTTDGVYQTFIDVSDMIAGDQVRIKIYEKCRSADTQRVVYEAVLTGAQSAPLWVSPALVLLHGWDVTTEVLAGTITLYWSIRSIA